MIMDTDMLNTSKGIYQIQKFNYAMKKQESV